eukprot:5241_1
MADPKKIYDLIKEVGSGEFGAVWKAENKKDKKIVAIKKIPNHKFKSINQEILALAKCDSEYIIKFIAQHTDADFHWIALEYCEGGSIEKNAGKYNESEIKHIALCVLNGLNYLHTKHKIIHRDVKPENILFHPQTNTYKLADFGVSKQVDQTMNQTVTGAGTLRYMAPEMIQDSMKIYNNTIDIWSLGITLYYLATNTYPYKSDGVMVMMEILQGKTLKLKNRKFSKFFCELVNDKCLVKDAKSRKSAQELLSDKFFTNDDEKDHDNK